MGVADVHGLLREGEIFASFKNPDTGKTVYLEGPTLISRSPTIHPGDVSYCDLYLPAHITQEILCLLGSSRPCHRKTTFRLVFRGREPFTYSRVQYPR